MAWSSDVSTNAAGWSSRAQEEAPKLQSGEAGVSDELQCLVLDTGSALSVKMPRFLCISDSDQLDPTAFGGTGSLGK